jgi:hypothetical protein
LQDDRRARRKQRHTAQRVYDRLVEIHGEEFTCSYRTVAGYVALRKKEIYGKNKSASLPLEHIPGEAQVDFGESDFYLDGELCTGHHLNLSFPHSNQGYAQLYRGENQLQRHIEHPRSPGLISAPQSNPRGLQASLRYRLRKRQCCH